ncbi:MAG TPA: DUF6326 family protein [Frankiaceae bacterium]|nr:DUF6326 family protein [Frankiaceae bacterium]
MSRPTTEHKVFVANSTLAAPERDSHNRSGGSFATQPYRDTPVDVKIVLAALWTAMLFVFAYVDIFAYLRGDVLRAALDGKVVSPSIDVNQAFLTATLIYILVPSLMVVLSLLLKPRVSRISNITISAVYIVTIVVSCIGETWAYYIIGSVVEVLLLAVIARTAWKWPRQSA